MTRPVLLLFTWLLLLGQSHAELKTFIAEGLSVSIDGEFHHDPKGSFGYVIRPNDKKHKKIRIHSTRYKGISLEEAARQTTERTKKNDDITIEESPIKTKSGISVLRTVVAKGNKKMYLERYYCKLPSGDIVCLCVYNFGDVEFSKTIRSAITESLSLKNKS